MICFSNSKTQENTLHTFTGLFNIKNTTQEQPNGNHALDKVIEEEQAESMSSLGMLSTSVDLLTNPEAL
jgi:hypothetical protein